MSNNKKSTYERLFGSDYIFDDSVLDEMQKRESYSIAFKLFRVMCTTFLLFGIAICCVGTGFENMQLYIAGIAATAFAITFGILYAGFTASKGIMPENFMKKNTGKAWIIWTVILIVYFILYVLILDTGWLIVPLWVLMCIDRMLMCFFAERNKKVREKMLDE